MEIWVWIIIGFIAGLVVYAVLNMIFAKDPSEELEKLADERAAELAKAEMKTAVLQDKLVQAETARDQQRELSEAECQQQLAEARADHEQALQAADAECREKIAAAEAAHREKLAQIEKQFSNLQEAFTRQAAEVGATLAAAGLTIESTAAPDGAPVAPEEADSVALEAALMASTGASMAAGEEVLEPTAKPEDDVVPAHETLEPDAMEMDLDLPEPVPELEFAGEPFAGEEPLEPFAGEEEADEEGPDPALVAGAAAASAMFAGYDEEAEPEVTADAEQDVQTSTVEEELERDSDAYAAVSPALEVEDEAPAGEMVRAAAAAAWLASESEDQEPDSEEELAQTETALQASGESAPEELAGAQGSALSEMGVEEELVADPDVEAGTPDITLDPTAMIVAAGGYEESALHDELSESEEPEVEEPEVEEPEAVLAAEDVQEQVVEPSEPAIDELATAEVQPAQKDGDTEEAVSTEEAEYLDAEEALLTGDPLEATAAESEEEVEADWREDTSVWTGEFFNNMKLEGEPVLVRQDKDIDFDWGMGSPAPEVNVDQFSARWTRTADLAPGLYRFTLTSDDGARLWVNDRLVISAWYDHTQMTFRREIELPGGPVDLRLEYYENSMAALVRVSWERIG